MLSNQQIQNQVIQRRRLPILDVDCSNKPGQISLASKCSFIYNQLGLDSCTACSICMGIFVQDSSFRPSPMFLYYKERSLDSSGVSINDGLTAYSNFGVCSEVCWPYQKALYDQAPSDKCDQEALEHRPRQVGVIPDLRTATCLISQGIPVLLGLKAYSNWLNSSGQIGYPSGKFMGGHEVLAIGYDDQREQLLCVNSWGNKWGYHGFFTLPYGYLVPAFSYSMTSFYV